LMGGRHRLQAWPIRACNHAVNGGVNTPESRVGGGSSTNERCITQTRPTLTHKRTSARPTIPGSPPLPLTKREPASPVTTQQNKTYYTLPRACPPQMSARGRQAAPGMRQRSPGLARRLGLASAPPRALLHRGLRSARRARRPLVPTTLFSMDSAPEVYLRRRYTSGADGAVAEVIRRRGRRARPSFQAQCILRTPHAPGVSV